MWMLDEFLAGSFGGDASISFNDNKIVVEGVLTKNSYAKIIEGVERLALDDAIGDIELNINSPGGEVDGLFSAMDIIYEASQMKPIKAVVNGMAASAAYGLASQANKIEASGDSDIVGSVGVISSIPNLKGFLLTTTSDGAEAKDAFSEAGAENRKEIVNSLADVFVSKIERQRSADLVLGKSLVAKDALGAKMIDAIASNTFFMTEDIKMENNVNVDAIAQEKFEQGKQWEKARVKDLSEYSAIAPKAVQMAIVEGLEHTSAKFQAAKDAEIKENPANLFFAEAEKENPEEVAVESTPSLDAVASVTKESILAEIKKYD